MKNVFKTLLNLIYPTRCPYCNRVINPNQIFCDECEISFPVISRIRTINIIDKKEILCLSLFDYHSKVKFAIWNFKFRDKREFSYSFSVKIAEAIHNSDIFNIKYDFITSVPMTFSRYAKRGYNQSSLIGKDISKILNIPYKKLLRKVINNKIQHTLGKEERAKNVQGVYKAININNIKGKTILLCDDIVTTGNTLSECVRILLKAGAKKVLCVTIADASKAIELIEDI